MTFQITLGIYFYIVNTEIAKRVNCRKLYENTYVLVKVSPHYFIIFDPFLSCQCLWCQLCGSIVQLAVFGFVDLVEVEREALAFLQTHVKTFFPDGEVESLKNIPIKRRVVLGVGFKGQRLFLAHSTDTLTV